MEKKRLYNKKPHHHKWRKIVVIHEYQETTHVSKEEYCPVCGKIKFSPKNYFDNLYIPYTENGNTEYKKATNEELLDKFSGIRQIEITDQRFDYTRFSDSDLERINQNKGCIKVA
jgi:hypothetical protein